MSKLKDSLEQWGLSGLKINVGFLEAEFTPNNCDKAAAWDLYVELLTRNTTQRLDDNHGDEKTALDSVFSIFAITRGILKHHGGECVNFTKVSIIVLNQIVRPFTAKWHKISIEQTFKSHKICQDFRVELSELQEQLEKYTKALADIAGVEDLTYLEDKNGTDQT